MAQWGVPRLRPEAIGDQVRRASLRGTTSAHATTSGQPTRDGRRQDRPVKQVKGEGDRSPGSHPGFVLSEQSQQATLPNLHSRNVNDNG